MEELFSVKEEAVQIMRSCMGPLLFIVDLLSRVGPLVSCLLWNWNSRSTHKKSHQSEKKLGDIFLLSHTINHDVSK